MIYTMIDTYENDTYYIRFTHEFINLFKQYCTGGSYVTILYRLFGLLPQDFYHYLNKEYNATFQPNPYIKRHIRVQFKNKTDVIKYANEIDKRIKYFIDRGDFK